MLYSQNSTISNPSRPFLDIKFKVCLPEYKILTFWGNYQSICMQPLMLRSIKFIFSTQILQEGSSKAMSK